jgi:hypothetical protein
LQVNCALPYAAQPADKRIPKNNATSMDPSTAKICRALLDVARVAEVELHQTEKGKRALSEKLLDGDDFNLLERIDGVRSVEHLLAISDDVVNVHSVLGKLIAAGFAAAAPGAGVHEVIIESVEDSLDFAASNVSTGAHASTSAPAVVSTMAPMPVAVHSTPAAVPAPTPLPAVKTSTLPPQPAPVDEVSIARRLLSIEAKHLFGASAARLLPKIEACKSIEEIYDIIVKFQQHLAKTGTVDPDVFLDRLAKGLAEAKKRAAEGASG